MCVIIAMSLPTGDLEWDCLQPVQLAVGLKVYHLKELQLTVPACEGSEVKWCIGQPI